MAVDSAFIGIRRSILTARYLSSRKDSHPQSRISKKEKKRGGSINDFMKLQGAKPRKNRRLLLQNKDSRHEFNANKLKLMQSSTSTSSMGLKNAILTLQSSTANPYTLQKPLLCTLINAILIGRSVWLHLYLKPSEPRSANAIRLVSSFRGIRSLPSNNSTPSRTVRTTAQLKKWRKSCGKQQRTKIFSKSRILSSNLMHSLKKGTASKTKSLIYPNHLMTMTFEQLAHRYACKIEHMD